MAKDGPASVNRRAHQDVPRGNWGSKAHMPQFGNKRQCSHSDQARSLPPIRTMVAVGLFNVSRRAVTRLSISNEAKEIISPALQDTSNTLGLVSGARSVTTASRRTKTIISISWTAS